MKPIGIDYTPAYEQGGGIGRYVRELVTALSKIDQTSEYNLFVSGALSTDLPQSLGSNFHWNSTWLSPKWLARVWHRFRIPVPVEIFTGSLQLFHATDFVLPPTLPAIPTVLTVHDLSFVRVPESASPSLKRYLDTVVPRSVRKATYILADSQATASDLIDLYGISSLKVGVLLSGVSGDFSQYTNDSVLMTTRKKYNLENVAYIFTVGTVQPRKNYVRLIQSLVRLRSKGFDIHLAIAGGKGWLDNPIYAAITDMHMEDFVHFIGFVADEDLPALYKSAVCLAFPSLYEGFGLPVLEAMASGIPVLTSNVSSLPEVAGDAAITVDPYDVDAITDGLERLLVDTNLRNDLVKRGLARANEFTWEKSARQLRGVYQSLIDQKS